MLTKKVINEYRETYDCGEADSCDCYLLRMICDQALNASDLQARLDAVKAYCTRIQNISKNEFTVNFHRQQSFAVVSEVLALLDCVT